MGSTDAYFRRVTVFWKLPEPNALPETPPARLEFDDVFLHR
jgi:hypothetical protein